MYGPSGSGKTTFSRALGQRLGLPLIELDALFHDKPEWQDATRDEFRAKVAAFLAAYPGGWVTDGNYHSMVGDLILAEADTAIWLRLPFRVVYPRLARRTVTRLFTRELLWDTNRERWRDVFGPQSMLVWGITNWRLHHRKVRERLREAPDGTRIVVLRSTGEVREYLARARFRIGSGD